MELVVTADGSLAVKLPMHKGLLNILWWKDALLEAFGVSWIT